MSSEYGATSYEVELTTEAGYPNYDHGSLSPLADLEADGGGMSTELTSFVKKASKVKRNRRWSVIEKLESRHYCRVRSFADCWRTLNWKCLFATLMLGTFIVLALTFAHVLFYATEVGSVRFDYIIIGASPAGLLIAHDLVYNGAKVLVLEAGQSTQYEIGGNDYFAGPIARFDVPYLWPTLSTYPDYKWGGYDPDAHITLAKGVGGAGVMGPMTYLRALPSDIKKWGIPNVTWERFLGIYKSLEWYDHSPVPDYHGTDGTLATSHAPLGILGMLFQTAVEAAGVAKTCVDFNDPSEKRANKVGTYQTNIWRGVRDSAALHFLKPLLNSPNLVVQTNSKATKILFTAVSSTKDNSESNESGAAENDGKTKHHSWNSTRTTEKKTIGIEFISNGVLKTAYLRIALLPSRIQEQLDAYPRGVMLSGGSINNAKLLINSGVGPTEQIRENKENQVVSEGVGRNLQDHPVVAVLVAVDPGLSAALTPTGTQILEELPAYIKLVTEARGKWRVRLQNSDSGNSTLQKESQYGPLASPLLTSGALIVSPYALHDEDGPDIQINAYPTAIEPYVSMYRKKQNESDDNSSDSNSNSESEIKAKVKSMQPLLQFTVTLLKPEGRQRVVVDDRSPQEAVKLLPEEDSIPGGSASASDGSGGINSHLSKRDRARLAWGVVQVRKILEKDPLKAWIQEEVYPSKEFHTTEELEAWVQKNAIPSNHWTGTCKIGPAGDSLSVLDERFQVYGIQDLRVVDASAMPTLVGANIGPTELALAKYASKIIVAGNSVDVEASV